MYWPLVCRFNVCIVSNFSILMECPSEPREIGSSLCVCVWGGGGSGPHFHEELKAANRTWTSWQDPEVHAGSIAAIFLLLFSYLYFAYFM